MADKTTLSVEELIGLEAEVVDSSNKSNIGIKGKIVDETRSTIIVETNDKKRLRLIKQQNIFVIIYGKSRSRIDGSNLAGRPEERIKKWLRPKKQQRASELK